MLDPLQILLIVLLLVSLAVGVSLALALRSERQRLHDLRRRLTGDDLTSRKLAQLERQGRVLNWITRDYLRFMRTIHGPIKVREISTVLLDFLARTFDPAAIVIVLRRKPALSDPDRERQLVVAAAKDTRVRPGGVIEFGEGDLGYVAKARRAMDRRELDQTPSAGGDAGALAGFQPELVAPMAVGSRTLGVVGIGPPGKAQARAKELLDLIAHTTALALENTLVLHKIRTAASADPLTGIYNKGAVAHQLDELLAVAEDEGQELAVFLFDLDNFKNYNDTNGHVAGDELLRLLASLVSDEVRTDDVFGRFGGEEFLLVMPGRSAEEGVMTAEKVLRLVRRHDFPQGAGQPLGRVTISGGVAVFPEHAADSSALLEAADRALYRAKERGRDKVLVAQRAAATSAGATASPGEERDDLRQIKGIGPSFEQTLNEIGISTYHQIAELNWTRMVLVASRLNTFPERLVRDRWLQQARELHLAKYGERL